MDCRLPTLTAWRTVLQAITKRKTRKPCCRRETVRCRCNFPRWRPAVILDLIEPEIRFLLLCLSTPAGAQAAEDTPPLRPILCLALCFAPAQFHVSQLLLNCPLPCVLWSSSVSTTLRGPSQSFFRYTAASFPHCVPSPGPLPTSNRL